ncbi:glycosyl hydrolase family 8 [Levilactobacillus namurensis]|uniref:glycosyl hydrolase family 8 n=1 Tax=Levilactobacillus namurensis TaxID=380393 RepID=UPI002231791A|nr:glycosyl hydrolase family 8 [Levilactobacillus namurensis]
MKRWTILIVMLVGLLSLSSCGAQPATMTPPDQSPRLFLTRTKHHTTADQHHQRALVSFLERKMLTDQGIYTNYADTTTRQAGKATGHELLSESAGMWLLYLAQTKQFKRFRTFYQATVKTFGDHGQFSYRYDPRNHKRFAVNATLDDLRIIRALNTYDALTGSRRYRQAATTSSLAYADFKVLHYYQQNSPKGRKHYRQQLKVVKGGYLGDVFPLYAASFNWHTLAYSTKNLNTSEALETLLHLAEIGQLRAASKGWLVQQVQRHQLYNGYTTAGSASDTGQSAGNYALAAMIFAVERDQANYRRAMRAVWANQITQGTMTGALGDAQTRQSYSFNNLTAILAANY